MSLAIVGVIGLLAYTNSAIESLQVREKHELVERYIQSKARQIIVDINSMGIWDQAYATLTDDPDLEWTDGNVGSYFADLMHYDTSLVLGSKDQALYGWVGEGRLDLAGRSKLRGYAAPLIARLREQEAQQIRRDGAVRAIGIASSVSTSGIIRTDRGVYLAAAATVVPETTTVPRRPGRDPIVLTAVKIGRPLLADMEAALAVKDARLEPIGVGTSKTAVILRDPLGEPLGELTWTQTLAGPQALERVAPLVLVGFLVFLTAYISLGFRIRDLFGRLAAGDEAMAKAMDDLTSARDQADAANVAKSQFLANMSHEIRTPLNGILGMAQVMEREDLPTSQSARLKVIRDSGQALLLVLNDILDFSKIEAGRLDIDVHAFDLVQAVEMAAAPFWEVAAQKGLAVTCSVPPSVQGGWRGDSLRLGQVLSNLISNAIKFTASGSVHLEIRLTHTGLQFAIRDSGLGIPADRIDGLFKKFNQVDASTTRRFGGTGLGLAISRELVTLMGGTFHVASMVDYGSVFSFDLPLERCEMPVAVADSAAEPDESVRAGVRILAAEDNATNQVILRALMAPFDIDLVIVADGKEALEMAKIGGFDLILMDVQMPVMSGVEATLAIRAWEAETGRHPIPILALSANVMSHQTKEYLSAGMMGAVAKPIEVGKLMAAIEGALAAVDVQDIAQRA